MKEYYNLFEYGYDELNSDPSWNTYVYHNPSLKNYLNTHDVQYGKALIPIWTKTSVIIPNHHNPEKTSILMLNIDGKTVQLAMENYINSDKLMDWDVGIIRYIFRGIYDDKY
jgi:hypothetical protein